MVKLKNRAMLSEQRERERSLVMTLWTEKVSLTAMVMRSSSEQVDSCFFA